MFRHSSTILALAALLSSGSAIAARPAAMFGPPWISIEYPPSPYDQTTRDAYLLVHSFHHGTPTNFPVTGTAEGIVRGPTESPGIRTGRVNVPFASVTVVSSRTGAVELV